MQNLLMLLEPLKNYSLWGNSAYNYALAGLIFIGFIVLLKIIKWIIVVKLKRLAEKTENDFDDALLAIFSKVKPPFYFFIALYFGLKVLIIHPTAYRVIGIIILLAVVWEVVQGLSRFVDYFIRKMIEKNDENGDGEEGMSQSMLKAISSIVKAVLWVIAIILILANVGIDVTSLIASLGIGGIAIALALQNILGDMFSSFSLYADKPFKVGDFVTVGKDSGTIEKIGLKSTRMRTLQGEELIVSNKELTTVRVQNFKKLEQRRVVVNLGIIYETRVTTLRSIPKMIQEIVKKTAKAEFDRCHFASYGDFSLNFEIVYFVNSPDYKDYMDVNQKINLAIFSRFNKEGIEFAYPTQQVIVEKAE